LWYSGSLENNSEFGVSGFNALPSGYRNYTGYEYSAMGFYCHFWSSTSNHSLNSWRRAVGYNNSDLNRSSANKGFGLSIRCIKDSQ